MLPEKVFQLDYQDYAQLVELHLRNIREYETSKHIRFDAVVAKMKNGLIAGTIIANNLHLELGVVRVSREQDFSVTDIFLPASLEAALSSGKSVNILLADSLAVTGESLQKIKTGLLKHYPNLNVVSYCTIVNQDLKYQPDIIGMKEDRYIQPPWEWKGFTPQSHLDRLENNTLHSTKEDEICIGFSSELCKESIEELHGRFYKNAWTMTFEKNDKVASLSTISNLSVPTLLSPLQAKTKYKKLIEEKKDFIQLNGLTHFIEDDLVQALLLSHFSPVCHIVFFDGADFYKIYGKQIKDEQLF